MRETERESKKAKRKVDEKKWNIEIYGPVCRSGLQNLVLRISYFNFDFYFRLFSE